MNRDKKVGKVRTFLSNEIKSMIFLVINHSHALEIKK